MYDLHLSAEQLEIRDTVREFVANEIRPMAIKPARMEALDRRPPHDVLQKASRMGLRTLALSEALGGAGADALTSCIVAEELAAGDPDVAAVLVETSLLSHLLFDRLMTPAQRDRFLPLLAADDSSQLALASHEPGSDTELGINYHRSVPLAPAVQCAATRTPSGDWLINGAKTFVPNATLAALVAVPVKTDSKAPAGQGVSTLLVPNNAPGMIVRELEQNAGWYHGLRADITFEDCRVPGDHLLGEEGNSPLAAGIDLAGRSIPAVAAMNVGLGRAAYEAALDYAGIRVQGARRIIEHQAIGTLLADMAIRLETARTMVWKAAWVADNPAAVAQRSVADLPLTTLARVYSAEAVHRVALAAAEVFGGMGVMRDIPMHKYVQDALIFLHSGMSPDDGKLRIAEALAEFRRA
ncbi:MAG: acyl-CoA dehydrogenase family protein [Burkholderiales bacterium]|nr:acyl-CoA dehydrogenase family protein [Burkholderiales bacterium]